MNNNNEPKCEKRQLIEKYITPASCSGNEEDRARRINAFMHMSDVDVEHMLQVHYNLESPTQTEQAKQEQSVNQQQQQPRRVTDFNRKEMFEQSQQSQRLMTAEDEERMRQIRSQNQELTQHNDFLQQVNQDYNERRILEMHAKTIKMSEEQRAMIQERNAQKEAARLELEQKQKARQEKEDRELVFSRQPSMKNKLNEDIDKMKQDLKDILIPKIENYFSLDSNELADYLNLNLKIKHRIDSSPVSHIIKRHEYREGNNSEVYFTCKCGSQTQYEEFTDIEYHCYSDSPEQHKKLALETIQEVEASRIIQLRNKYEADIRLIAIDIRKRDIAEAEKLKNEELEERQTKIRKKLLINQ